MKHSRKNVSILLALTAAFAACGRDIDAAADVKNTGHRDITARWKLPTAREDAGKILNKAFFQNFSDLQKSVK